MESLIIKALDEFANFVFDDRYDIGWRQFYSEDDIKKWLSEQPEAKRIIEAKNIQENMTSYWANQTAGSVDWRG